jgi:hypothetical protein
MALSIISFADLYLILSNLELIMPNTLITDVFNSFISTISPLAALIRGENSAGDPIS